MEEKRKTKRLKEENKISLTVIENKKHPFKEKRIHSHSIDISRSGAKIHSSVLLPIDTRVRIRMPLKALGKMVTTVGKVKWVRGSIFKDRSYEAGVEFFCISSESIQELEHYISRGTCFNQ
jgi:hypothetical protein